MASTIDSGCCLLTGIAYQVHIFCRGVLSLDSLFEFSLKIVLRAAHKSILWVLPSLITFYVVVPGPVRNRKFSFCRLFSLGPKTL